MHDIIRSHIALAYGTINQPAVFEFLKNAIVVATIASHIATISAKYPAGLVEGKENPRLGDVQRKLQSEYIQGRLGGLESGRLPNEPRGDRHHDIKCCPDRTENAARWIPRWLLDCLIPAVDLGSRCDRTQSASAEGQSYEDNEGKCMRSFIHVVCLIGDVRSIRSFSIYSASCSGLNCWDRFPSCMFRWRCARSRF